MHIYLDAILRPTPLFSDKNDYLDIEIKFDSLYINKMRKVNSFVLSIE